jgi:HEPN domain-containing protein
MTSSHMGRRYIEEAGGRLHLVRVAVDRGLWATAVREAQECAELFLKGALRLVGVEPSRVHDVAEVRRREADRFPEWFRREVDSLAGVSTDRAVEPRSAGLAGAGTMRPSPTTGSSTRRWWS